MSAPAFTHIRLDEADCIATLTIDRPQVLNAVTMHTLGEMIAAVDRVRDAGTARVLVLTGGGRAFCSGADLSVVPAGPRQTADLGSGLETGFNPLIERLRRLPIPVVVAVNGAAVGGGCGLALAGDILLAARSAYFLLPFVNIGLVPDVGTTWLLPRLIGKARATAAMLLGERIPADQAADWGMIYRVVDDAELMPATARIAARLAVGPTTAYAMTRRAIDAGLQSSLTEALARERADQRVAGRTAAHEEGVAAFLEKRPPVFRRD